MPKPHPRVPRNSTLSTARVRAKRLAPDARKAQILECALAVFARDGLSNATHAAVAAAAGVAEATVFVYYPTRIELERTVLDEVARFLLEEVVAPIHDRDEPAAEILEKIMVTFGACIDTHRDHARVWLEWSTAIRDNLWPHYLEFQNRAVEQFKAIIVGGLARGELPKTLVADDAARVLVGFAHMIALMKFAGSTQVEIGRLLHSLIQGYIIRDVAPEDSPA